ncbi:SDR family NAD(P)-dependent oxidoreductase [Ferrovibrio terrae]|uniref:SDR family NAD(P)-dependent oxidoreductase n=1 Tax=Ferrovibrio terrae TaxID=2594003 RepID=A0A516H5K3_9PROT|nr:SDR family NAD(P)-dependent oxidoreductase [Ferrovibrio terrae]QDO99032.1 SDR family NAD(P)-dependent oxidoreductase [Ferrovibrio terrae]
MTAGGNGVVWITGAGSGIGRALALRYLRAGAVVAGTARRIDTLESLKAEAGQAGSQFNALPADLIDLAATRATVARIEAELGPIRLAVLNAGTHLPTPGRSFRAEAVRQLLDANVMTVANALDAVLPVLLARRTGMVAINASLAGYRGLPSAAGYGASKAALINMAEALKLDLQDSGIRVRLIAPGFVKTPLTDRNPFPMPFLMPVDAAAERLWQALESGSGFEIVFPRRFAWLLKLLRLLPYRIYFPLVSRMTRS